MAVQQHAERAADSQAQCRACWLGVNKIFRSLEQASVTRSTRLEPSLAVREVKQEAPEPFLDGRLAVPMVARAQAAFPAFAKFQRDFHEAQAISFQGLRTLCAELEMDITEVELERLFVQADRDGDLLLSVQELSNAAQDCPFLGNLVNVVTAASAMRIGKAYDYERTTCENHAGQQLPGEREGGEATAEAAAHLLTFWLGFPDAATLSVACEEVAVARRAMPSQREVSAFSLERSVWQHAVVARDAAPGSTQEKPWLIVTLSQLEGYPDKVLTWMSAQGFLPGCHQLRRLSAEAYAQCVPEFPCFVRHHGALGAYAFVREEAEFLQALACELAMSRLQHVWLECRQDDAVRLTGLLRRLRERHSGYKLALLDVRTDAEALVREKRGALRRFGRKVADTRGASDECKLLPLITQCHFAARIDNSENQPVLEHVQCCDGSGCWQAIQAQFSRLAPSMLDSALFPRALPPLRLQRCKLPGSMLQVGLEDKTPGRYCIDLDHFGQITVCPLAARRLKLAMGHVAATPLELHTGPVQACPPGGSSGAVVFEEKAAGERIKGCMWVTCPTAAKSAIDIPVDDEEALVVRFLMLGAFAYVNEKGLIQDLDIPTRQSAVFYLQFGAARPLGSAAADVLSNGGRWCPVGDADLRRRGAISYCWLVAGEFVGDHRVPSGGAFAYQLGPQAASIAGSEAVYFAVIV